MGWTPWFETLGLQAWVGVFPWRESLARPCPIIVSAALLVDDGALL